MRNSSHVPMVALIIAILSLVGCGGGDIDPPPETAKAASEAFPKAYSVLGVNPNEAPGLDWSRDASIPEDRLVVRFGDRVVYDERRWFAKFTPQLGHLLITKISFS